MGVLLKDSTFINETEVTSGEYAYFLDLATTEMSEYLDTFLPDVDWPLESYAITEWRSVDTIKLKTDPRKALSVVYPPILGVTYEQAQLYCIWLSKYYTSAINKRLISAGDSLRVTYKFRLPSEFEWRLAAGDIKSYENYSRIFGFTKRALRKSNIKNVKKRVLMLSVRQSMVNDDSVNFVYDDNINFPGSVYSHPANARGIKNMIGNVAEMVAEEGVALGGSWKDSFEDIVRSNLRQSYTCPESWLGFRYACDVSVTYNNLPDTVYNFIPPKFLDRCSAVAQRREMHLLNTDGQYSISKLREWVVNNERINLSTDTLFVNGIPTVSLDQINVASLAQHTHTTRIRQRRRQLRRLCTACAIWDRYTKV